MLEFLKWLTWNFSLENLDFDFGSVQKRLLKFSFEEIDLLYFVIKQTHDSSGMDQNFLGIAFFSWYLKWSATNHPSSGLTLTQKHVQ